MKRDRRSEGSSRRGPDRRTFLAALGAFALPMSGGRVAGASRASRLVRTDPRLTARPGRPTLPAEPGETRLGEELDRGALLYVPPAYDAATPAPLVVTLHGAGGSADRWRGWYPLADRHGFVLLAPESRARTWDVVNGEIGPDARFLDAALRRVFERCVIDPAHIALAGFSDGASYALSLGPSNGDLFTHLIALSPGFSMPDPPIVGSPRVFVSHGLDDSVLPWGLTAGGLVPMLRMDGYETEFVEFEGRHEMPEEVVAQAMEWFLG